jgi:hypothetical protein
MHLTVRRHAAMAGQQTQPLVHKARAWQPRTAIVWKSWLIGQLQTVLTPQGWLNTSTPNEQAAQTHHHSACHMQWLLQGTQV